MIEGALAGLVAGIILLKYQTSKLYNLEDKRLLIEMAQNIEEEYFIFRGSILLLKFEEKDNKTSLDEYSNVQSNFFNAVLTAFKKVMDLKSPQNYALKGCLNAIKNYPSFNLINDKYEANGNLIGLLKLLERQINKDSVWNRMISILELYWNNLNLSKNEKKLIKRTAEFLGRITINTENLIILPLGNWEKLIKIENNHHDVITRFLQLGLISEKQANTNGTNYELTVEGWLEYAKTLKYEGYHIRLMKHYKTI